MVGENLEFFVTSGGIQKTLMQKLNYDFVHYTVDCIRICSQHQCCHEAHEIQKFYYIYKGCIAAGSSKWMALWYFVYQPQP